MTLPMRCVTCGVDYRVAINSMTAWRDGKMVELPLEPHVLCPDCSARLMTVQLDGG